tara:strand:+ start:44 stop:553 length:510 start_codon:yes stop_codon:yes gene_type:complete
MKTTTLNELLKHGPCASGWVKLTGQSSDESTWVGDDEPLGFDEILKSNGLDDALWACRVLEGEDLKLFKLFICDIAERALVHVQEGGSRRKLLIDTARRYLNGECSEEELYVATIAADTFSVVNASYIAANYVYAAVYASGAASAANGAAAGNAERKAQEEMFINFIGE